MKVGLLPITVMYFEKVQAGQNTAGQEILN